MAMVIANNSAAMLTLGEVNKNNSKLGKALKKVSSGMRINGAGDDASGYAISEKMRARIRALDQDERNTQTGSSLLRVAEGGVKSILDELRTIKELALNAANDHNTDLDRATIQKEVDNRLANIDDIAVETNYNGKLLLDGSIRGPKKLKNLTPPEKPTEVFSFSYPLQYVDSFTIDKDGIYSFRWLHARKINITAQNVMLRGFDSTTSIVCQSPNTNLWLAQMHIQTGIDESAIKFSGGDNTLTIMGEVVINRSTYHSPTTTTSDHALVNVGGGLTIFSEDLDLSSPGHSYIIDAIFHIFDESFEWEDRQRNVRRPPRTQEVNAPLIGLDAGERNSKAYLNIVNGTFMLRDGLEYIATLDQQVVRIDNHTAINSALIGAGANGTFGDISILGGDVTIERDWRQAPTEEDAFDARTVHYDKSEISTGGRMYGRTFFGAPLPPEPFHGLRIHTGTRANENLAVTIESMKTEDIGISELQVVTQKKATAALDTIDAAIDYVLDQATHIGAYISRLNFTEANLVTSREATQISESTIRDADMAKEMTEYTKANVLMQAAQSMLAQANQTSSSVLSLLQ